MSDAILDKSALKEAVSLGQKVGTAHKDEKIHYAIVPQDCKLESLLALQYPHGLPPERVNANVKLKDSASFAAYVKLYEADNKTRTFADPDKFNFLSVIDYHGAGSEMKPEFCSHRVSFIMEPDDRWTIWNSKNNVPMAQADFAEFIEDNQADIHQPEPARMLEIASDLTAHTEVNFGSSTRLQNGQVRIKYEETVKAGVGQTGDIEVPEEFSIKIPVFYGEDPVVIKARLRFRITNGKLTFHYRLNRPKEVQDKAFDLAVKSLSTELATEILIGNPF